MPARPSTLSRRSAAVTGIALALAATLSGCGASAEAEKAATAATASPTASSPPTTPAAADSPAATTPAAPDSPAATAPASTPTASSPKLTKGKVTVRITGASPAIRLVPGGPAHTFTVQVGNGTARTYKDVRVALGVEPIISDGGESWADEKLVLQRLDPATGRWLPDDVFVATDVAGYEDGAPGSGGALKPGAARTIKYRISAGRGAPVYSHSVVVYAVTPSKNGGWGEVPLANSRLEVKVARK
jgi:hypothetical protein